MPFIIATWANSHRSFVDASLVPCPGRAWYEKTIKPVIERLIEINPPLVAHCVDDDNQLFGWVCASKYTLFYAYTKDLYRQADVFARLYAAAGCPRRVAFWTPWVEKLQSKYGWEYRPSAVRRKLRDARKREIEQGKPENGRADLRQASDDR